MRERLILAVLALLPAFARAQETQVQYDTIYTYSGDIVCHVLEDTGKSIIFSYPGESLRNTLPANGFRFVQLASGRVIQGAPRVEVSGIKDWEKVILTSDPREIEGLELAGDFQSRRHARTEYCEDEIRKKAAEQRCHIVLVESVMPHIASDIDGDVNTRYVMKGLGYRYAGLGEELSAADADPFVQQGLLSVNGGKVYDYQGKELGKSELQAMMPPDVYKEFSNAAATYRTGKTILISGFAAEGLSLVGGVAGVIAQDPAVTVASCLTAGLGFTAGIVGVVLLISADNSMDFAISDHNGRTRATLFVGPTRSGAGLALRF